MNEIECPHPFEEHRIVGSMVHRVCRACRNKRIMLACQDCDGSGKQTIFDKEQNFYGEAYCVKCDGSGYERD